jgi:AcrR family transcriptional regulator
MEFSDRQIEIMELATKRIDQYGIQELTIKNLAADINLSEAALYRHFKSKNDILLSLLSYFIMDMEDRMSSILERRDESAKEQLKTIFQSQLKTFVQKPSIVSVVFSEGIFQFNKQLAEKLSDMMQMMNGHIERLIEKGKEDGEFITLIGSQTMATIVMGSMRMVVLKWKLSGHKSNLLKDGNSILSDLLKMFEKSN